MKFFYSADEICIVMVDRFMLNTMQELWAWENEL
jgi:hypothetical protein